MDVRLIDFHFRERISVDQSTQFSQNNLDPLLDVASMFLLLFELRREAHVWVTNADWAVTSIVALQALSATST